MRDRYHRFCGTMQFVKKLQVWLTDQRGVLESQRNVLLPRAPSLTPRSVQCIQTWVGRKFGLRRGRPRRVRAPKK
eukprot:gene8159-biopygen4614